MACDPDTLMADAKCFQCGITGTMQDAIEVLLLCAILDGDTSLSCDPNELSKQASCLFACIPPGAFEAVKVSLLCQIAAG